MFRSLCVPIVGEEMRICHTYLVAKANLASSLSPPRNHLPVNTFTFTCSTHVTISSRPPTDSHFLQHLRNERHACAPASNSAQAQRIAVREDTKTHLKMSERRRHKLNTTFEPDRKLAHRY